MESLDCSHSMCIVLVKTRKNVHFIGVLQEILVVSQHTKCTVYCKARNIHRIIIFVDFVVQTISMKISDFCPRVMRN